MSGFSHVVLRAGEFPNEWWMRDLAGRLFAVVGRYSEPTTWQEARLYTGYNWHELRPCSHTYGVFSNPAEGVAPWMTHAEVLTLPAEGGSLLNGYCPEYYEIGWFNRVVGEWYNISDLCRLPVGEDAFVVLTGGGSAFGHSIPNDSEIGIYFR